MASIDSTSMTIGALRESPLLSDEQRHQFDVLPESIRTSPVSLHRELIQRGLFTVWQLEEIAQGRGNRLLIGPYVILDRLGEGGMGQVFKARHRELNRLTALKVIRPDRFSVTTLARFKKEARAAAALRHPNVVMIYDCGETDGIAFAALEFVDGIDLQRLVKDNGPLPIGQACETIRQAALGLQHAHEHGLIHRDIKPANLIVTSANPPVVKILDFGLARLEGETNRELTAPNQMMGTLAYIAPEQAENARKADIRSDIFSLGCTLHFLLSGSNPFRGNEGLESLSARLRGQFTRLRDVVPHAPQELESVITRMLARDPDARFQTPGEVAASLVPFASAKDTARIKLHSTSSVQTDQSTADYPKAGSATETYLIASRRRFPFPWRSIAVTMLLLSIGTGVWLATQNPKAEIINQPVRPEQQASILNGANGLVETLAMPREVHEKPVVLTDPRGIVIGDPSFRTFGAIRHLAVSPDGKRIAAFSIIRTDVSERISQANFMPHGMDRGSLVLFDGETGRVLSTLALYDPDEAITALSFSEDGQFLAAGMRKQAVRIWNLSSDNQLESPMTTIEQVHVAKLVQFQGNGLWLMDPGSLRRWHPFNRRFNPDGLGISMGSHSPGHAMITSDGRQLAFFDHTNGTLTIKDITKPDGQSRKLLKSPLLNVYSLAISPDGKRVAVGGNPLQLLDISEPETKDLLGLKIEVTDYNWPAAVAFNRDGTLLAVGRTDGDLALWEVGEKPKRIQNLRGHDNEISALAFTADGKTLISAGADHRIRIWKSPELQPKHSSTDQDGSCAIMGVAFSKSGRSVLTANGSFGTGWPRSRIEVRNAQTGELERTTVGTWNLTDLAVADDGDIVYFGGRNCPKTSLMGYPFFSIWRWRDGVEPSHPTVLASTGHTVRFAVSDSARRVAMLADPIHKNMPARIEIRTFRDPILQSKVFLLKGTTHLALSPDGKRLALACELEQKKKTSSILIYDVSALDNRSIANLSQPLPDPVEKWENLPLVTAMIFGDTPIYADMNGKIIRDAVAVQEAHITPDGRPALCLTMSRDGSRFAAGTDTGYVIVWKSDDWKKTLYQAKFTGPVHSIQFDAEGKRIVAGLGNSTAMVITLP